MFINIPVIYMYTYILVYTYRCTQMYFYIHHHIYIYMCIHIYIYIYICIYTCIYIHLYIHICIQLWSFPFPQISEKYFTYRSVQRFKILFLGFYCQESDPPHRIMRYLFYYSTQLVFQFHLISMIIRKCFVPQLYQFRRGISGGPALKYFYMIHRGGRIHWIYCIHMNVPYIHVNVHYIHTLHTCDIQRM